MNDERAHVWVGIDAGKAHHWVTAIDDQGAMLWTKKVSNDEGAILDSIAEVLALGENFTWAVDIVGTTSALLLALLARHGQSALYVPGRIVNRMAGAYRGEAKTDARDAYVIAETARHRHDLAPIRMPVEIIADLKLLIAHRSDLVADRVRMLNRLRDVLTGIFPRLDRAFDYAKHKGALTLLTGYQTPIALRRMGQARLTKWLSGRGVQGAPAVAEAASRPRVGSRRRSGTKRSRRRSSLTSQRRSSPSTRVSERWRARSPRCSTRTRRPRSSSRCPGWVRSSEPNSSPQPGRSITTPTTAIWLRRPG